MDKLPITLIVIGVAMNLFDMVSNGALYGTGPLASTDIVIGQWVPGSGGIVPGKALYQPHIGGDLVLIGLLLWAYRKWF